jgi:hypothetical protein
MSHKFKHVSIYRAEKITIVTEEIELTGLIEVFERYLLACGFVLNGKLTIRDELDDTIDRLVAEVHGSEGCEVEE